VQRAANARKSANYTKTPLLGEVSVIILLIYIRVAKYTLYDIVYVYDFGLLHHTDFQIFSHIRPHVFVFAKFLCSFTNPLTF